MWNNNYWRLKPEGLIYNDKLMGETVIDLEDRFFHPKWTSLGDVKPLEVCRRSHNSLTTSDTKKYNYTYYVS